MIAPSRGASKVKVKKGGKIRVSTEVARDLMQSYKSSIKIKDGELLESSLIAMKSVLKNIKTFSKKELENIIEVSKNRIEQINKEEKAEKKDIRTKEKKAKDKAELAKLEAEKKAKEEEAKKELTKNQKIEERERLIDELNTLNIKIAESGEKSIEYNVEAMSNEGLKELIEKLKKRIEKPKKTNKNNKDENAKK